MVYCMVVFLLFLFVFPWFAFLMKVFWYICIMVCKGIYDLVRWGNYVFTSIQWWNFSWFVIFVYFPEFLPRLLVGILEFIEFKNLFHVSFLKTLCLMALLCWNVLNLILFVESRWCFLYSIYLAILSSLTFFVPLCYCWSSLCLIGCFTLLFVVWFRQGSYVLLWLWFGSVLSLLFFSFWNYVQFALPMLISVVVLGNKKCTLLLWRRLAY